VALDTQSAALSVSASGDTAIVPAVAGKRIELVALVAVNAVATAQAITLKSGSTALTGAMALPSSIGGTLVIERATPAWFRADAGAALNLNLSAATAVGGFVVFRYV
jgi:hypothetical protein